MRAYKMFLVLFTLTFVASISAVADTCNAFASYTCSKSTPDVVHVIGGGTTGQSVGILLTSNTFNLSVQGNHAFAGDDLIILAAAPNGLTGTINSMGFTSLSSFPEGGAIGAITDTWAGLGFNAGNVQFGYVNLGVIGSSLPTLTASGVGSGTIFYAEIVSPDGKILYITPNSEAGVLQGGNSPTPEPASLTLLGTGLAGLAGLVRRKVAKKA